MRTSRCLHAGLRTLCGGLMLVMTFVPAASEAQDKGCPHPAKLWAKLTAGGGYISWKTMPELNPANGQVISMPVSVGEKPHGDWVAVYVNGPAYDSIATWNHDRTQAFKMLPGSILVKENYPPGPKGPDLKKPINARDGLESLTVMWKLDPATDGSCNFANKPGKPNEPQPTAVAPPPPSPAATNAYLWGGEWYWAMFTNDGSGSVVTLANQPWIKQFNFTGETQAGKPYFCITCHQNATGVGTKASQSYGDWVWRVLPFDQPPQPAPPPPPPPPPSKKN